MSTLVKLTPSAQPWIGSSDVLFKLKQQIQHLAQCDLPIHIVGQPGSGKHLAACHIHELSKSHSEDMIVSCVNHWQGQCAATLLEELVNRAQSGTIYLKNIDALTQVQAESIKDYWLTLSPQSPAPRLITSTSAEKQTSADTHMQSDSFLSWLHYHCLELPIPPLYNRKEDIIALINHYKHTCKHLAKLQFQGPALEVLTSYDWPHNVKQLKRCLDKLTFLCEQPEITKQTLLTLFPAMENKPAPTKGNLIPLIQAESDFTQAMQTLIACDDEHSYTPSENLDGADFTPLSQLKPVNKPHPALARALQYIDDNFKKPLSLSEVASYACVSPSHLSFLFKRYVGQSFKQTLLRIRIKTAMTLLREDPYSQVTEVCDDVGFSDLSFFVRKFKSVVGVSPGAYRDHRTKH
ncbi:AraC family transcriptional regulator [Pseudoalteromonas sp. GCY]|uniref:AraC family transcriptional regulator n=1 Tax=Pseudoalteromonas sp. GCY TaxID=2003316 RepID=UPI000BFED43F|nr:AraC family transcriptional regulator [Pseudoalteromonas sp. GCY]PHI37697.1 AraC family transcriptional regulator [Pseudoalteromonas sp. GCY]QQQ68707.1 helix-turn-helix domain-containing protein [Pseudoalteromonas sp. GCY]